MKVLTQAHAVPEAEIAQLQARLQAIAPTVQLHRAEGFYVLQTLASSTCDLDRLCRLLQAQDRSPLTGGQCSERLALPRMGTRSPWSTKATELLLGAGLPIARIERGVWYSVRHWPTQSPVAQRLSRVLHDPLTQSLLHSSAELTGFFTVPVTRPLVLVELAELVQMNRQRGLALTNEELTYLRDWYQQLGRCLTDAELMMFAQANSEHCRHKIFNATWLIDDQPQEQTLFGMIRHTHACTPAHTLSAYADNAAVIAGQPVARFRPDPQTRNYGQEAVRPGAYQIKVETHNHPTAIAPFPGAATGAGGEIRDEGATGRGGKPKAGLTGFTVGYLRIPSLPQPWEGSRALCPRMATALEIMRDGPLGSAAYNNEFGRPNLLGYFRSFEINQAPDLIRTYDKPIMLSGGLGVMDRQHIAKHPLQAGDRVVVFGGPAMLIGLGGGAASSMAAGVSDEQLDFASVQRDNPEMERRCQEVIDCCVAFGSQNPLRGFHDVGAGGLANAVPELLADSAVGGIIDFGQIPSADPALSPMELWCNEAQERYVAGISQADLTRFAQICQRERCPFAVIGTVTADLHLLGGYGVLDPDRLSMTKVLDVPLAMVLGKPPLPPRVTQRRPAPQWPVFKTAQCHLEQAGRQVLAHPTVAAKTFLITIGDRSVGGLTARDQMIGPWQLPVADCALTLAGFQTMAGEAMAIGERTPLALLDVCASARMAIGEALTNLCAAPLESLASVKLSANWMAAAAHPGEDAQLYDAVRDVALDLCPALDLAIPVGKDSLSMQVCWCQTQDQQTQIHQSVAPVSLVISAFAAVADVRGQWTALLCAQPTAELWLLDLGCGQDRLGGSILAQVSLAAQGQVAFGGSCPNLDDPGRFKAFFALLKAARQAQLVLAYHDRSDGGAFATLAEMAFASHLGVHIELPPAVIDPIAFLLNEELGAVVQVATEQRAQWLALVSQYGLSDCVHYIGHPIAEDRIAVHHRQTKIAQWQWHELFDAWWSVTHAMQTLRDDPRCAQEEWQVAREFAWPGLRPHLTFSLTEPVAAPMIATGQRPRVAILREQGINGQIEMAYAFTQAGFQCIDVHMNDLLSGQVDLKTMTGLAAGGGFSYGDVLGAGRGWASAILDREAVREQFSAFFRRSETFALGICNGCQMLSQLKALIPGAAHWPEFLRNRSGQFEARTSLVAVTESPSIFFQGMVGSRLLVAVAHGEGRVQFAESDDVHSTGVALRYVDEQGQPTECYPLNPNGSTQGITGLTSTDGRVTIMMPHPERTPAAVNFSWHPQQWPDVSPWQRFFANARHWCG